MGSTVCPMDPAPGSSTIGQAALPWPSQRARQHPLIGRREQLFVALIACLCAAFFAGASVAGGRNKSELDVVHIESLASAAHRIHDARKHMLHVVKPCEETYGLFPCSSSLSGSIFLTATYGFLLLKGANLISDGSELLLEVLDPGLIGGLVLPILGALPDSAMIVMSGLGGTVEQAKEQVAVGIGTLAGSTIMLLSVAWGGSLWVGRCDLDGRGVAKDKVLTKDMDFFQTGVTTDEATRFNAYIMIASAFLYLSPQIPTFMGEPHDPFMAMVGGILCLVALGLYCAYQVVMPELQKRKKDAAHKKFIKINAMKNAMEVARAAGSVLMDENGQVKEDALRQLFLKYDEDRNGTIDRDEMRKMMTILSSGQRHAPTSTDIDNDLVYMMQELDKDGDGCITFQELKVGMQKWMSELAKESKKVGKGASSYLESTPLVHTGGEEGGGEDDDDDEEDDDEDHEPLTPAQIMQKAALLMLGGSTLVAFFSDPLVDSVSNFSKASGVPAFFVAFVITPFASNASELVSSLNFAKKKKIKNISLTYSQVYGAVTMNNSMCLGLFLLVVWYRSLDWTFSSETVTTMASIFALGFVAATRDTFPTYLAFVSMALYPAALALVSYLDYVVGWQ